VTSKGPITSKSDRYDWKMRDQISRVEKCRTGKCGTGKCRTGNAGLENGGPENAGVENAKLEYAGPVSLRELNNYLKKHQNLLCIVV